MIKAEFDAAKAIEAILYIVSVAPVPDVYHIGKILYFADRIHLENYGRLITGDSYIAMKNGSVASGTYDILKIARGDKSPCCPVGCSPDHIKASLMVLCRQDKGAHRVISKRAPDMDFFSRSDIECLQTAVENYGDMTFEQLNAISHDDVWKVLGHNSVIPLELIAKHCKDSKNLIDYLSG